VGLWASADIAHPDGLWVPRTNRLGPPCVSMLTLSV
jgi:hypothetical protein